MGIFVVFILIAMLVTPLAVAKPWDSPKNNEKFQTFVVEHVVNPMLDLPIQGYVKPEFEEVSKH